MCCAIAIDAPAPKFEGVVVAGPTPLFVSIFSCPITVPSASVAVSAEPLLNTVVVLTRDTTPSAVCSICEKATPVVTVTSPVPLPVSYTHLTLPTILRV